MKCPEDRSALEARMHDGHAGHVCGTCRGVWLPGVFVESLAFERELRLADFYSALLANAATARPLACPRGCGALSCARVHEVEIDWCLECRGVWFNPGELRQLLSHFPLREGAELETPTATALAADVGIELLLAFLSSW